MSSTRGQLDNLLNFYDEHKPEMKGRKVEVFLEQSTINKFAKLEGNKRMYRGYEIARAAKPGEVR